MPPAHRPRSSARLLSSIGPMWLGRSRRRRHRHHRRVVGRRPPASLALCTRSHRSPRGLRLRCPWRRTPPPPSDDHRRSTDLQPTAHLQGRARRARRRRQLRWWCRRRLWPSRTCAHAPRVCASTFPRRWRRSRRSSRTILWYQPCEALGSRLSSESVARMWRRRRRHGAGRTILALSALVRRPH